MKQSYSNLHAIPDFEYIGYIWEADEQSPDVFSTPKKCDWTKYKSYIVEGWLYCKEKEEELSIHIKHTGTQQIFEYHSKEFPPDSELVEVSYLPHRLKNNIERVYFQQLWIPEKDPLCEDMEDGEGMEVLKMKALIFTGFNNQPKLKENV